MRKDKIKKSKTPLCAFSFSPAFTIQEFSSNVVPSTRRPTTPFWRRSEHSLSPTRPRFKPYKTYSHTLAKFLTGRVTTKHSNSLTLQEVLNTLKEVWISPSSLSRTSPSTNMDERWSKKSPAPADASSPVLLRRRLSAPETIMRKHMLVQQRSQDGDLPNCGDAKSSNWRMESGVGSDTNLSRKRDIGFMRKSTLMRRLWGSNKPLSERGSRFSGYSDWQHGKSNLSLSSNNSSPEHTKCKCKYLSEDSKSLISKRFKASKLFQSVDVQNTPKLGNANNRRSYSENYSQTTQIPETKSSCCSNCTHDTPTSSSDSKNTTAVTEIESEIYSTRSTSTTENSDSAYTNSRSNLTHSSCDLHTRSTEKFINGNPAETECRDANQLSTEKVADSSTQTANTTNLNVISNVQLSQATLNLIFNQVLQDVQKSPQSNINISTMSSNLNSAALPKPQIIRVKQVPNFYLKDNENGTATREPQHRVLKYMVGNVTAGGPYGKTTENSQVVVPRYSALPRTTSMEVNTSSGESDRESDNVSLVDSLEGSCSPRVDVNQNKFDDKSISPLLPDNSVRSEKATSRSSVFFIPIETSNGTEVKSVADHLPDKVRERLSKRQIRRQQKLRETKDKMSSPKSDSNYISASDNGNIQSNMNNNQYGSSSTSSNQNSTNKSKKKSKPLLPSINSYRRSKNQSKPTPKDETEKIKDKTKNKKRILASQESVSEKSFGISKIHQKVLEKLSPMGTGKKDFPYNVIPNRIYHKTELSNSNKHIEILEIVECIGTMPDRSTKRYTKSKHSKIPVLVQSKLPSISKDIRDQKPTFLDFEQVHKDEPKVDQLIANILIDALNKTDLHSPEDASKHINKIEKRPPACQAGQLRAGVKYQQKFEVIPEERGSNKASSEDTSISSESSKNNNHKRGLEKSEQTEADLNNGCSTTSKNWVTFYAVQKNETSLENSPDEGRKEKMSHGGTNENHNLSGGHQQHFKKFIDNIDSCKTQKNQQQQNHIVPKETIDSLDGWTSSENEKRMKVLHPFPSICRNNQQKKHRFRSSDSSRTTKSSTGEWTVTVSGVTSGKEFAPDLEMRLIFPHNQTQKTQEGSHRKTLLNKKSKTGIPRAEMVKSMEQLPDIGKQPTSMVNCTYEYNPAMSNLQICDHGRLVATTKDCSNIEPRQTRTSTRRLLLNRPRTFAAPANYMEINIEDNRIKDILQQFPGILKITGNAISPELKPKLPSMSEKDVTRHLHRNS